MTLARRLRNCMEKKSISVAELARRAQVPSYFIHDILNEKSTSPSPSRLCQIADHLDVSLEFLIGNVSAPQSQNLVNIAALAVEPGNGKKKPQLIDKPAESGFSFQRDWVAQRLKATAADLRLVAIETDHMAPTLLRGDHVLVDMSRNTTSPLGMFVLFDGMGLTVQRLERLGKNDLIRVSCDNPAYAHKDIPLSQLDIIGRVVWYAHEL